MTSQQDLQAQHLSEPILGEILSSVTDAVVTIDEAHRVVFFNRAAEEMFGYGPAEVLGRDASPLIPNPHQAIHQEYVERYLDSGIPRVIGKTRECSVQRRDGTVLPVDISYSVSRTEGQLYFTAIIRDISRRKDLERQMRFMEKLADVGKAVAQVVHEIRKPLMVIGGFARQVESSDVLKDDGNNRHKLDIIVQEVQRLDKLLNGVRLISRPRALSEYRSLAINELLKETLELWEPMLPDGQVDFVADLAEEPLMVIHGDPDRLKQVFLNLLQNAADAMQGVGTIRLTSRLKGGTSVVTIEDGGPGIPDEVREKVFDPFFSTKPEGTGLGLAVSRAIIQDHGGLIDLRSNEPHGTIVIVELPLEIP